MAVGLSELPWMHPIKGVELGTCCAGIKYPERKDLVVVRVNAGSSIAGVFTRNAFCAAPVQIARQHLSSQPEYLLINTGNANAGTGDAGYADAMACCEALANQVGVTSDRVLPFSTGVIGEPLPCGKIIQSIPDAVAALDEDGWKDAAQGILTTDTLPKGASLTFEVDGQSFHITGISKGAGMIKPDMATMLAFIATDVAVAPNVLQQLLATACDRSFNRITIDGDTSTNDSCILMATGTAGNPLLEASSGALYEALLSKLVELCQQLAQAIVRDGEGASKFVSLLVEQASTEAEALDVAYTIAHSPLVKTALFASDPNWGRVLAAVGRANISDLDVSRVQMWLDDVRIVSNGGRAESYREEDGQRVMDQDELLIRVQLGRGEASEQLWTTDLSHEYVRINAEYRS
ncbi:bifunctional glutamate N-acetyltransferase/amino-acid acetyltransferase ArgJ [Aestuariirhabdus sp. Z084]|uniref:bifunctional glutamate N-acetyltransferase/amino-acid acetyltransferase ArgJ n=1 Tax=Aestuariirhabdus haliotis TaxID=2918751 RepID=UPI00201B4042|nr:bifunctional glutamate N-acetyltransferase/amino-acid acetyltransferase ArgJ [Aestuariirhabdus haliotis]MCL6415902.1 bifunctional glutamate N-acetyltransferase/amino-acid acetyltransferase ArgJ [Aestuariirhabdus haliotis]MCL6419900.1 bifunctional glutamate N-acetyltransferase/amino-acid acetyltransferase ArgJ [Aestuariirhabdus haliotis]